MPEQPTERPAGETCRNGHARTAENTYRRPSSGKLDCQRCRDDNHAKQAANRPSSRKASRSPIDPAVVAQMRAAAGLPPGGGL